ncbi:hypothetical protein QQ045_001177 [Rhodiola kirilowii]
MQKVGQKRMEFDSGPKEKDIVPEMRIAEEDSVDVKDGRAHNLVGRNAIVFDSGPKEKGVYCEEVELSLYVYCEDQIVWVKAVMEVWG